MPAELRMAGDGRAVVSGDMVFATVPHLLEQGAGLFDGRDGELEIDLAPVGQTDSAGFALLLEWLDQGRQCGCTIRFRNLPVALLGIARLSNAEGLLPVFQD
jgi:phospholipid transport system transporter-binding protein